MSTGAGIMFEDIAEKKNDNFEFSSVLKQKKPTDEAVKITGSTLKETIVAPDQVVAAINSSKCINCGACRENCPVDAIEENQRAICHVCPTCTEIPGIPVDTMYAMPTDRACTTGCPLGISPQGYVNLTKLGKYDEAYKLVWEKNPLPEVCGSICHHPCESDCKRGLLVDKPIGIRELKKYLGNKVEYQQEKYLQMFEEKVAIVGAGPAGLTAGHYLARTGYDVTIFEGSTEAGGMMLRGIPEFRLDRDVVRHDIAKMEAAGLKIKLNQPMSKATVEALKSEYDAIIVSAGAPNSKELFIDGWRLSGIMTAMNFMEHVNNNQKLRRHLGQLFKFDDGKAVIIGGGSVAMDCARTAVRAGASKVTVVCMECGDDVPAHQWEMEEAKEEGIEIIEGYSPIRYTCEMYPTLTGVDFEKVLSCGKDAEGKFIVETDPEDTIHVDCDWAVVAIGQSKDNFWSDVSEKGVFFAGDISSNKCSVIDAMASGRKAALDVDAALQGRALKDPVADKDTRLHLAPVLEKLFPYNFRKTVKPEVAKLSLDERLTTFKEVEGVFTDKEAYLEADRCLNCGYEFVDIEKCIGCGICRKLCPKGDVISMVPKMIGGESE